MDKDYVRRFVKMKDLLQTDTLVYFEVSCFAIVIGAYFNILPINEKRQYNGEFLLCFIKTDAFNPFKKNKPSLGYTTY